MTKKWVKKWQDREQLLIMSYGILRREYKRLMDVYKEKQIPSKEQLETVRSYLHMHEILLKSYEEETKRQGPVASTTYKFPVQTTTTAGDNAGNFNLTV